MKEKVIENTGRKYSEMLYELVQKFDEDLPKELTVNKTIEIGIEAWNIANNKDFLEKNNLYEKELKNNEYYEIINEMIKYKQEKFHEFNNIIVDFSLEDDKLQVKTQTFKDNFDSLIKNFFLQKPE